MFGCSYLLLFTFEVATSLFLPISVDSSIEISNYMQFSIIPFLKSKLNLPKKENNKIFIILAVFLTKIKEEIIDLIIELTAPIILIKTIYLFKGFRAVLNHILQHLKINYIIYIKKIGWFIIFTLIVFVVRKGIYYIIFNNASFNIKDLCEIFKYDAILVFLLVRFNNKLIIMLVFKLFKKSLLDTIVEIDKCYNTKIFIFLENIYSIFKVKVLINKFKSFKSNIESYIFNLFNLLNYYWYNFIKPTWLRKRKKECSYKKGMDTNEPLILMLPATITQQGSSSTANHREGGEQDSNTTLSSSSAETEFSSIRLVRDHHLLNKNIDFINREQIGLNLMIENVEDKLKPFEKKRLRHLQNGGNDNNTSELFSVEDRAKYLQFSNNLSNLKASFDGLTGIFKDLKRIKRSADYLDDLNIRIAINRSQLLETEKNLDLLYKNKKELEFKKTLNNLDPKNRPFTNDDAQKLISAKSEILELKKLKYNLEVQIEGKEVCSYTATRDLKKERIYLVRRESEIVSEAISDNNPIW